MPTFDKTLDLKGKLCPLPIVLTKKELLASPKGLILKVVCTDCGSVKDFQTWVQIADGLFELLDQEVIQSDEGLLYIYYLKKL